MFDSPLPELTVTLSRPHSPLPEIASEVIDAVPALVTLREHTMQPLSAVERGIAQLRQEHGSTAYDITTPAGYRLATLRRAAVRKVRYEVPKIVKAKKAELAELREQVETEGERIVAILRQIEDPHDALIEAEDARKAAIKAEAARVEAERVAKHEHNLALIRSYLAHAQQPGMTAERIAAGMDVLAAQTFPVETWQEFAVTAANVQCETLEAMRVLHAQTLGREQEAARQEAIRAENERVAAELAAERARIEAEAAEIRRQAAELAAQRAESDRLERLAEENRARLAAAAAAPIAPMGEAPAEAVSAPAAAAPAANPPGLAELRADTTPEIEAGVASMLAAMPGGEVLDTTTDPTDIERALSDEDPLPPSTVSLLALNDHLGFRVTSDFLAYLGVHPAAGMLYAADQFPAIKAALITHITNLEAL